jgi:hypothetical protein
VLNLLFIKPRSRPNRWRQQWARSGNARQEQI